MYALLLALFLLTLPAPALAADQCDSLYVAAEGVYGTVSAELGRVRSSPDEQRQWRQLNQRLLRAADRVRSCYRPLLASPGEREGAAPTAPDDIALPRPTSLARQRVMEAYGWSTLAHRELQDYDAAFQQFDTFFQRFGASADSAYVALMYNQRGYMHYQLGNLTEAINDYSRTIAHTPAADTLDRANLVLDFGAILQKANDQRTAQEYHSRAAHLARTASPSTRQRTILARALFAQGDGLLLFDQPGETEAEQTARYQQAIDVLQRAIAVHPEGWSRLAITHIVLAKGYRLIGNYEAAFHHLERGEALAERGAARSPVDVRAYAALTRGQTELAAGQPDAAVASLHEAVRLADLGNDVERRRHALFELGEAYEINGDFAQAETYYRQSIAVANELRASLRATEWAAYTSDNWSAPHRGLVRALLAQDRPIEAFLALDRSRARHLQDRQLQTRLTGSLPPRERIRFDSLTAELADARSALATDDLSPDRRATLEDDEVQLMAARRSLLDLTPITRLSSLSTLQSHLRAQQRALIAYYIDSASLDFRAPTSHAFVVTPNAFRAVPLPIGSDSIRAQLAAVSPLLDTAEEGGVSISAVNFDLAALHQLYTDLFAPVAEALPNSLPLTIIPDGPLFRLPFGMLVTDAPGMALHGNAPYLIRERALAMELSASLVGDPARTDDTFSFDIAALGRTQFETVPPLPPALRPRLDSSGALPDLPGVQREMEALSERFARRQVVLNDRATERRLRTLQSQTKILHLASHALIHPSDPLANLFVLSPDGDDGRNDGLLFVHELGLSHAAVPLVVLSGCRTAQGLMRIGEGPKGLQYAFRSAGARSTLSTLWDADDEASVLLTSAFYDHLLEGLPKDEALRQAQLDLIEQRPDRASPFFWAGAILYGSPRPLALESAPPIPLLPVAAGGAVLLLVALGFGYSRYRRHQL